MFALEIAELALPGLHSLVETVQVQAEFHKAPIAVQRGEQSQHDRPVQLDNHAPRGFDA
jgi:hypothetical protein